MAKNALHAHGRRGERYHRQPSEVPTCPSVNWEVSSDLVEATPRTERESPFYYLAPPSIRASEQAG